MGEPITLDLEDDGERCYTCRRDLASLAEPTGIAITIQEPTDASKMLSICSPCVTLLDFERTVDGPRNLTGCVVLPDSKLIIKRNEDNFICLRCLSQLEHERDIAVSIREGIFDKNCPSLPENAVYEFAVHLCGKCSRWKKRCSRMKDVIGLGYPMFNTATCIVEVPTATPTTSSREAIQYPVSMLVNKAKALVKTFMEGASLSSPPPNIRSNIMYLHCIKPNSLHWSCDGFQLKKMSSRVVRIANSDHVIKESNWSTSGNQSIKTDFKRRVITSSDLEGITIIQYLGEILESKQVPREVAIVDDDEESSHVTPTSRVSRSRTSSVGSSTSGRTTPPLPGTGTSSATFLNSLLSIDNESPADVTNPTCPEITNLSYFTMPSRHAALTTNIGGVLRQQFKLMPLAVFNKVWNGAEWSTTKQSTSHLAGIHPDVIKEVKRLVTHSSIRMHPSAVTEAFLGLNIDEIFSMLAITNLSDQASFLQLQNWHDWKSFSGPFPQLSVKYTLVPVNVNIHKHIIQYIQKSIPEMKKIPVVGSTETEVAPSQKQFPIRKKSSTLQNILNGIRRSTLEDPDDPDDPDDPFNEAYGSAEEDDPDYNPNSEADDDDLLVEEPHDPLEVATVSLLATNRKKALPSEDIAQKHSVLKEAESSPRQRNNSGNLPTISKVTGSVGGSRTVAGNLLQPIIRNVMNNETSGIPTITNVVGNASSDLPTITNVVSNAKSDLSTITNVVGNSKRDLPTITNAVANASTGLPIITSVAGNVAVFGDSQCHTVTNVNGSATNETVLGKEGHTGITSAVTTVAHVMLGGIKVPVVLDSNGQGVIFKPDGSKLTLQKSTLGKLQAGKRLSTTGTTLTTAVQPMSIAPRVTPLQAMAPRSTSIQTVQFVPRVSAVQTIASMAPRVSHKLPAMTMDPKSAISQSSSCQSWQANKTVFVKNSSGQIIRLSPGNIPGSSFLPGPVSQANLVAGPNINRQESQLMRYKIQGKGPNNGQVIVVPSGGKLVQIPGSSGKPRLVMVNPKVSGSAVQKPQDIQTKVVIPEPSIKAEPSDPLAPQLSPAISQVGPQMHNEASRAPQHKHLKRQPRIQNSVLAEIAEDCIFKKRYSDVLVYGSDPSRLPIETHSIVLASISNNMKNVLRGAERNSDGKFELVVPFVDLTEFDVFLDEVIGTLLMPPADDADNISFNIKPSIWCLLAGFNDLETSEACGKVWMKGVEGVVFNSFSTMLEKTTNAAEESSHEESNNGILKRKMHEESRETEADLKPAKTIKLASFCKLTTVHNSENIAGDTEEVEKRLRETLFEDPSDDDHGGNDAEMIEDNDEAPVMVAPIFEESLEAVDKYSYYTNKSYNILNDNLPIIPVTVTVCRMPFKPDKKSTHSRESHSESIWETNDSNERQDISLSLTQEFEDFEADLSAEMEMNHFSDDPDELNDLEADVAAEMVMKNSNRVNDDLDLELERLDRFLDDESFQLDILSSQES